MITLRNGYGFIRVEGERDRFFHSGSTSTPITDLSVGDLVEFDPEPGEASRATGVRLVAVDDEWKGE